MTLAAEKFNEVWRAYFTLLDVEALCWAKRILPRTHMMRSNSFIVFFSASHYGLSAFRYQFIVIIFNYKVRVEVNIFSDK